MKNFIKKLLRKKTIFELQQDQYLNEITRYSKEKQKLEQLIRQANYDLDLIDKMINANQQLLRSM